MISNDLYNLAEQVEHLEQRVDELDGERMDALADYDQCKADLKDADKRADEAEEQRDTMLALFKRFMQRWDLDRTVDDEVLRDMRWTLKAVA